MSAEDLVGKYFHTTCGGGDVRKYVLEGHIKTVVGNQLLVTCGQARVKKAIEKIAAGYTFLDFDAFLAMQPVVYDTEQDMRASANNDPWCR